jgi:hypothetical protein
VAEDHKDSFEKGETYAAAILAFYAVATDYCIRCFSQGIAIALLRFYLRPMTDAESQDYLSTIFRELLNEKRGGAETPPSSQDERKLH